MTRRNYLCCLVIVFIFIRLGEAQRQVEGDILKSSYGGAGHETRGPIFMGKLTPLDIMPYER